MAPIAICTSSARFARARSASRFALVSALAVAAYSAFAGVTAFFAAAPAVLERPRMGSSGQQGRDDREEEKAITDLIEASSAALEFATRDPTDSQPGTIQNPPWATCFVEGRREEKSVLEEWVMRGERENVDSFRRWRQRGSEPTSVRCMETSAKAALEAICLECVPAADALPFSTTGRVNGGILTFSSTQCLRSMPSGSGYCKSGQLTLP